MLDAAAAVRVSTRHGRLEPALVRRRRALPDAVARSTLKAMDRVRFGRALGYGARHAVKAVAKAVDAAAAPNPAAPHSTAAPHPTSSRQAQPVAAASGRAAGVETAAFKPQAAENAQTRSGSFGGAGSQLPRADVTQRLAQAKVVVRQGQQHAGHLRRHMWSPLARFSSVVWLQVTGTFFALVAAFLSQGLWKERGALRLPVNSPGTGTFYLHAAAFAIFVYFAVSSFVRAHMRQRR